MSEFADSSAPAIKVDDAKPKTLISRVCRGVTKRRKEERGASAPKFESLLDTANPKE